MRGENTELDSILARLGKVERENRRLKQLWLGVLVVFGAVLLMVQVKPNRTIDAEKFVLKDANGRTRARLEMELLDRPTLVLLDPKGFPLVSLVAGETPSLNLCRASCDEQVTIGSFGQDVFGFALYGKNNGFNGLQADLGMYKGAPALDLWGDKPNQHVALDLAGLDVSDEQGFRAMMGSAALETTRTGETHRTSAASVVLFGKDGNMLWSAP